MPFPIGAALSGLSALSKIVTGFSQQRKAHNINKNNPFPVETLQPEYAKNVALAENMGRTGLPQQQYVNSLQNINRNQTAGIRALTRSGRPIGVASLVRAGNDATMNLDAQDAMARQQNQRFAFGQRNILAQQNQRLFDVNKRTPWLQMLAKANALEGAGMQNKQNGLNDFTTMGSIMSMNGNQNQDNAQGQGLWKWYKGGGMNLNPTY